MSATQQTAAQLARCAALHKQFDQQRRMLRRETAVQAAAMRRLTSWLEMLDHSRAAG